MNSKTPLERAIAEKPNESFAVEAILEPMDQEKRKETLAAVEEHYHLSPKKAARYGFWSFLFAGMGVAVLLFGIVFGMLSLIYWAVAETPKPVVVTAESPRTPPPVSSIEKAPSRNLTLDQYYRIKIGMTYKQVVEVCGWQGVETNRSTYGYWMDWKAENGSISVMFDENGKVRSLFQMYLK